MSIRKIVLIPSLLLLAGAAYLAFRPDAKPVSPALTAGDRSAPSSAAMAAHGKPVASSNPTQANPAVPEAAARAVGITAGSSNVASPTGPAPVDVARVLADAGPVPGLTTLGAVPPEGSGQYGAPDRLSARRISANRTEGRDADVKSGDAVRITYRMYELMSGREVEASPPEGILVRVGTGIEDSAATAVNRVPRGVAESLGHTRIGDVVEVILPKGTPDLPPDLDSTTAHKLHVTVIARY